MGENHFIARVVILHIMNPHLEGERGGGGPRKIWKHLPIVQRILVFLPYMAPKSFILKLAGVAAKGKYCGSAPGFKPPWQEGIALKSTDSNPVNNYKQTGLYKENPEYYNVNRVNEYHPNVVVWDHPN